MVFPLLIFFFRCSKAKVKKMSFEEMLFERGMYTCSICIQKICIWLRPSFPLSKKKAAPNRPDMWASARIGAIGKINDLLLLATFVELCFELLIRWRDECSCSHLQSSHHPTSAGGKVRKRHRRRRRRQVLTTCQSMTRWL